MIYIELRDDGWFEAGKDCENTSPVAYEIYLEKQRIKSALQKIGEQPTIENLEKKLLGVKLFGGEFDGPPYLNGEKVIINTHGLPGEAYLGRIIT